MDKVKELADTHPGLVAGAVIVLATAIRLVGLGYFPGYGILHQDEAFAAYEAYSLLTYGIDAHGYRMPVYFVAWGSGMNVLESYLMVPFMAVLGPVPLAVRLPSLLVGVPTLAFFYCFARRCRGHRFALVALCLLSIVPWHVMACRWALESNLLPGMLMGGVLFLDKGRDDGRWLLLSALFFGLALYAYSLAWLVMPVLVGACVAYEIRCCGLPAGRWLAAAGALLFAMAVPLVLFVLVNADLIDEIRTPFMSVPRLIAFRDGDVGAEGLAVNACRLLVAALLQFDGEPWNYVRGYGTYYVVSLVPILYGIYRLARAARPNAAAGNPENLVLFQLAAGAVIGLAVASNINRINIVHIPMVYCLAVGIWEMVRLLDGKEVVQRAAKVLAACVYALMFAGFTAAYFTSYSEQLYWEDGSGGLEEAVHYVEKTGKEAVTSGYELADNGQPGYVYNDAMAYSYFLLYQEIPAGEFAKDVEYVNADTATHTAIPHQVGLFITDRPDWEGTPDEDRLYLCYIDDEEHYAYMLDNGMETTQFGRCVVGEPRP